MSKFCKNSHISALTSAIGVMTCQCLILSLLIIRCLHIRRPTGFDSVRMFRAL